MKRVCLWDDIGSIRSALTYHTESLMFNYLMFVIKFKVHYKSDIVFINLIIILSNNRYFIQKILKNDYFWVNFMESQLSSFYMNSMIFELIDSRYEGGLLIRDGL